MTGLIVTDHAMLRLFERGYGLDVESMRGEVASQLHRASNAVSERMGPCEYVIALGGLRYVVRNLHVVTILSDDMAHHQRKNGIARG
jgi:hypothetical protein